jgi:hypothetical protein
MRNVAMGSAMRERRLSRRTFVGGAAAAAGAVAVPKLLPAFLDGASSGRAAESAELVPGPEGSRAPVVGFHMDRPFLDPTGMAEPYIPPAGTRSGQALAELTESEFLSRHPYG